MSLTQGTLLISAASMMVRQDKEGFKYGIAWGKLAYFRQKREGFDEYIEGCAERIEYDGAADKVQMFTRAHAARAGRGARQLHLLRRGDRVLPGHRRRQSGRDRRQSAGPRAGR